MSAHVLLYLSVSLSHNRLCPVNWISPTLVRDGREALNMTIADAAGPVSGRDDPATSSALPETPGLFPLLWSVGRPFAGLHVQTRGRAGVACSVARSA